MGPSQKRTLSIHERAVLVPAGGNDSIHLDPPQFVIGRSPSASINLTDLSISRTHCIFKFVESAWLLFDKSSFGTHVNGVRLSKDTGRLLENGDIIKLGPLDLFVYNFEIRERLGEGPMTKRTKTHTMHPALEVHCRDQIVAKKHSMGDCKIKLERKKSERSQLEERLKSVQIEQSQLKEEKLQLEKSFNKQLVALKQRHNHEREEYFSQSLVGDTNEELKGKRLEQRFYEEQKAFEMKLNAQLDEQSAKIMESKRVEDDLMEENKNLIATLQQEREKFQERLELEQRQLQETQEKKLCEAKDEVQRELQEKNVLEKKLREMESRLAAQQEIAQEEMNKKLAEKEEERLRDLKQLQEQKDAQMSTLLQQVNDREQTLRKQLETEILSLREDKKKIEDNIRGEMSKKEGESVESLKRLEEELEKVKKDLNNTEGKKQFLEKELEQTNKAKENASEALLKARQDVLHDMGEMMETELQCSVCSELFVAATNLNCSHTFCRYCIIEWKKKKRDCPVCRAPIVTEARSVVLDSFIDRMVGSLTEDMKRRRQELVAEREVIELLSAQPHSSHNTRGRRNGDSAPHSSGSDQSRITEPIYISSDSDWGSDSSHYSGTDDEDALSSSSVEGIDGEYYGGFGHCYQCGRRGHWARGCPDY